MPGPTGTRAFEYTPNLSTDARAFLISTDYKKKGRSADDTSFISLSAENREKHASLARRLI